ncbi:hypothetical protein U9Z10_23155, partial [Escherichia coli]
WKGWAILLRQKQKKLIMLPSETMIWQPEFTDKTLSRKPGAVHYADELRPQEKAFSIGLFVTKSVMGKDTWQVTAKGYAWMQGNAQKWRELIADGDRLKAAERRAQKRLNRGGK